MKDSSGIPVSRWKAVCAYDGGAFDGWQSQPSRNAVQDVLERRLREVLQREVRLYGSGRTDAGVHALGQVFHFDAAWTHGPERLRRALQTGLPRAIHLHRLQVAAPAFHARFDAKGKIYRYELCRGEADPFTAPYCWEVPRDLDGPAMQAAAKILTGRHDFKAFSAVNREERETTVRELRRITLRRQGRRIRLTFEADGFLYKRVRSLTGALVNVGLGKLTVRDVAAMLRTARRVPQVLTAPPQGMFLVKVLY